MKSKIPCIIILLYAIGSFAQNLSTNNSDWMVGNITSNNAIAKASAFNLDDNSLITECSGKKDVTMSKIQSAIIKTLEIQGHKNNQTKKPKEQYFRRYGQNI
jgi:hypothetical protein